MEQFFLQLLNNAITVSFLILAVLVIRLVFWKMPKRMICLLWIAVAMKLILPFSMESNFSLIPSAEPIPTDITLEKNPKVDSGLQGMDEIIHSAPQQLLAPPDVASTNPHQIYLYIGVILWIVGIGSLTVYSIITYMRLKLRVRMSVKMEEKVYECDDIADPFIKVLTDKGADEKYQEYLRMHQAGKALSDALHGDTSDRDASNGDASNGDSSNNVVFVTDTVEITYQELKVEITGIAETGKERDVVVKDAVKSVVTKKYLYAKAKQAGIHVTTDEYEAYKTALSADIQNSENKEAVQAYFDGFGGEENYWKQMEATIMQNLTIHKYLNEQAANEKEVEEIKEKAYLEALTVDEEKELIRIADGIYE